MKISDKFARHYGKSTEIRQVQDNLQRFFLKIDEELTDIDDRVTSLEALFDVFALENGEPITGVVLAIGANTVNHTLGRVPTGYIVTRTQTANPGIYDTAMDATSITLQSAAIATIDLWVY